jgi:alkane 1-monooxygenase
VAFSLLELVNYIEHYGLERKEKDHENKLNRKYSKVTPMHSWNAAQMLSNYFLFKLQRHSDHHANAGKQYCEILPPIHILIRKKIPSVKKLSK